MFGVNTPPLNASVRRLMRQLKWPTILLVLVAVTAVGRSGHPSGFHPPGGFVPTADVAIAIAVAVWGPIYGVAHIAGEKPYWAVLRDGVWVVTGSIPKGDVGGVAEARIAQSDGRILSVIHGQ